MAAGGSPPVRSSSSRGSISLTWIVALVVALVVIGAVIVAIAFGPIGPIDPITLGDDTDEQTEPNESTDPVAALTGERQARTADVTIRGGTSDGAFGTEIVGDVDVTRNGYADLVVAAPGDDRGGEGAGAVYVFAGPIDGSMLTADDADSVLVGEQAGDAAGTGLAAGDVTGDGHDDLVIGAPNNDSGASLAGAAYVVNGSDLPDGERDLGEANATLIGESGQDRTGQAVAVVEDEGDGAGTVAVGAPHNDSVGNDSGAVALFDGGTLTGEYTLTNASAILTGESSHDRAGHALGTAEVAGDGESLLVGAPFHNGTETHSGAAYVVGDGAFGNGTALSADEEDVLAIDGADEEDRFGWALAAGDLTDDGTEDVIVGAPWNGETDENAGATYVFAVEAIDGERVATDADATVRGESGFDTAGWSVSSAVSDGADCDGVDDLLVGAPRNSVGGVQAGSAYVAAGDELSSESSLGDAEGIVRGTSGGNQFGFAVAAGGDLVGNGTGDIVVGSPGAGFDAPDAGAVRVFSGTCPMDSDENDDPTSDEIAVPDGNETVTPDGNETATPEGNETVTPDGNETATPDGNETATPAENTTSSTVAVRWAVPDP